MTVVETTAAAYLTFVAVTSHVASSPAESAASLDETKYIDLAQNAILLNTS